MRGYLRIPILDGGATVKRAPAFPVLLVAGPHANSRLGVVEAGRGLRELSAWLREREVRTNAEKRLPKKGGW